MAPRQLKPQFFVTRQNGAMVPLIAMDELPIHVQIHGVSRNVSALDTAGMTGVGTVEARHQFYVVDSMNNTKPIPFDALSKPNSTISTPVLQPTVLSASNPLKTSNVDTKQTLDISSDSDNSATSVHEEPKSSRSTSPAVSVSGPALATNVKGLAPAAASTLAWRNFAGLGASKYAPKEDMTLDPANPPAETNPEMPPEGQKVYCAFWLRNGECNFAQQGCMYKHVMPLDLAVLGRLGFLDLPDWYRKAYKCGSLRINGGRNGLSYGIVDGNVRAGNGPRARVDPEASRRAIAAHINSMPMRGGRPGNTNKPLRPMHQRLMLNSAPRLPALMTDAEKAKDKERRDIRLAAAFDADMASTIGEDMMDAEMEKIREREQAAWDKEQKTRKAAVTTEKKSDSGSEKKTGMAGSGAEVSKKKGRGRYGVRRKVLQSDKE